MRRERKMSTEGYREVQLSKISNRSTFLEFRRDTFDIQKIHMLFSRYDQNRPKGNRTIGEVSYFLNAEDFLYLGDLLVDGQFLRKKTQMVQNSKSGSLFERQGGTSALKLAEKHNSRPDGKAEARILSIRPATKGANDYVISAKSGPGRQKGNLIVPEFIDNKPEQYVEVAMTHATLQGAFDMVKMYYQAYVNIKMQDWVDSDNQWHQNNRKYKNA